MDVVNTLGLPYENIDKIFNLSTHTHTNTHTHIHEVQTKSVHTIR